MSCWKSTKMLVFTGAVMGWGEMVDKQVAALRLKSRTGPKSAESSSAGMVDWQEPKALTALPDGVAGSAQLSTLSKLPGSHVVQPANEVIDVVDVESQQLTSAADVEIEPNQVAGNPELKNIHLLPFAEWKYGLIYKLLGIRVFAKIYHWILPSGCIFRLRGALSEQPCGNCGDEKKAKVIRVRHSDARKKALINLIPLTYWCEIAHLVLMVLMQVCYGFELSSRWEIAHAITSQVVVNIIPVFIQEYNRGRIVKTLKHFDKPTPDHPNGGQNDVPIVFGKGCNSKLQRLDFLFELVVPALITVALYDLNFVWAEKCDISAMPRADIECCEGVMSGPNGGGDFLKRFPDCRCVPGSGSPVSGSPVDESGSWF